MTLSQKLVILRKTKGITQDELANILDVSRQSVYKWESGQCYPEVPKIIKMKEIFEISIDDLLDDNFEVALPEKKKRRSQKKDDVAQPSKEETPVLAKEEKAQEEPVEEISVEVIEEAPIVKEEVKAEEPEEKKRGFFSKIFGRR